MNKYIIILLSCFAMNAQTFDFSCEPNFVLGAWGPEWTDETESFTQQAIKYDANTGAVLGNQEREFSINVITKYVFLTREGRIFRGVRTYDILRRTEIEYVGLNATVRHGAATQSVIALYLLKIDNTLRPRFSPIDYAQLPIHPSPGGEYTRTREIYEYYTPVSSFNSTTANYVSSPDLPFMVENLTRYYYHYSTSTSDSLVNLSFRIYDEPIDEYWPANVEYTNAGGRISSTRLIRTTEESWEGAINDDVNGDGDKLDTVFIIVYNLGDVEYRPYRLNRTSEVGVWRLLEDRN